MGFRSKVLAVVLAAAGWAAGTVSAQALDSAKVAAVQAAYLRSLAAFTTWPADAFADAESPLVIAVVGGGDRGPAAVLEEGIARKGLSAQNRPLQVVRVPVVPGLEGEDGTALTGCHVVFVCTDGRKRWEDLRALLGSRAVLTVCEEEGFARGEGMVEFALAARDRRGGKGIDMVINLPRVKEAGLRISSRLLGLKQGVTVLR